MIENRQRHPNVRRSHSALDDRPPVAIMPTEPIEPPNTLQ
jgi:hypothetical protein